MNFGNSGHLKFSKSDDFITTPFLGNNDITQEISQIMWHNGLGSDNFLSNPKDLAPITKYRPTADGTTIYVWAHGNRHRDVIAAGNTRLTPDEVLDFLVKVGIKTSFAGDICIWSCWAGVLDGFCHALALRCRARGFLALSVWGNRFVTGTMLGKKPLTLGSELLRALDVEGIKPAALDLKGQFRPTTLNDLNLFSPANAMAIKAAEV